MVWSIDSHELICEDSSITARSYCFSASFERKLLCPKYEGCQIDTQHCITTVVVFSYPHLAYFDSVKEILVSKWHIASLC